MRTPYAGGKLPPAQRVFYHYAIDKGETQTSIAKKIHATTQGLGKKLACAGRLRIEEAILIAKALNADPCEFVAKIITEMQKEGRIE